MRWLLIGSTVALIGVGVLVARSLGTFALPSVGSTAPAGRPTATAHSVAQATAVASPSSVTAEPTRAAPTPATTAAPAATPRPGGQTGEGGGHGSGSNTTGGPGGTLVWRDRVLANDTVIITISGLAAPGAGEVYAAWLASDQHRLPLGPLTFNSAGLASITYTSPNNENLLGLYDRAYITNVPQAQATTDMSRVVLSGALPPQALLEVRQILFSNNATPNQLGFALGLRQQSDELLRQAQFLQEAFGGGNLAEERLYAEYLVNLIEGAQGQHFGDLNGDGRVENPGDGYGLLPNGDQPGYIKGMIDRVHLAAQAPDATEAIRVHSQHVQITGENARVRYTDIRDRALRILQASDTAATQQDVVYIMALLQQAIYGIDLNLNELVEPIPGEGGVVTAYQHAQLMVSVPLAPEGSAEGRGAEGTGGS